MAIAVLLSLMFGAGMWLVYEGLTAPAEARVKRDWLRPLREFLNRAGLHDVPPRDFIAFSIATGVLSTIVAQLTLGWTFISPMAGWVGASLPYFYYSYRQRRRRTEFQTALVDAVAQLRSGISTGLSVQEALVGLAKTGPKPLRPHFATLARELRLGGFEEAMWQLRERLADPLMDVVGTTLVLNEQLGGRNVSQVLDGLVNTTRGLLKVEQEVRAYQAQNIAASNVIAGIPIALIVGLRILNPSYLEPFSSGTGAWMLVASLASLVLGYAAMRRFTRLPGEPRVLQ